MNDYITNTYQLHDEWMTINYIIGLQWDDLHGRQHSSVSHLLREDYISLIKHAVQSLFGDDFDSEYN